MGVYRAERNRQTRRTDPVSSAFIQPVPEEWRKNTDVKIYLFGHTHHAFLKILPEGTVINTGSWLKQLTKIPSRFWLLPDVYYPYYCLNYFVIREENNKLVIKYHVIEKEAPSELSLLQRFVVFGRKKGNSTAIPKKTVVG